MMNKHAVTRTLTVTVIVFLMILAALISAINLSNHAQLSRVPSFVESSSYIIETGGKFQWLDPAISYYQFDYDVLANVYEKLIWYDANSTTRLIPWLAENYSQLSPRSYQFKLREGVRFQDGRPFDALAVWFSLNRLLIIDGGSGTGDHGTQAAWILQQLLNTTLSSYFTPHQHYDALWVKRVLSEDFVQIINPHLINIDILTPSTQFLYLFANEWADIVSPSFVVSHDYPQACKTPACDPETINYTAYFDHIAGRGDVKLNYLNLPLEGALAGTGPYYLASVNPTTYQVVLKANPDYWGGPPKWTGPSITRSIKTIIYRYVPDFATRLLDIRAGAATEIAVSSSDIFSLADRKSWLRDNRLISILPGVEVHGPFPALVNNWFNFVTNVTDVTGHLQRFQPFADIRFRVAVASAANLTEANIYINNRMGILAGQLVPPGTAPLGTHDPTIKPAYTYNLTRAEALLRDAQQNPLTHFVDQSGKPYPLSQVDNSFGPNNPHTINMYVAADDTVDQRILTEIAVNLNQISSSRNMGLTFNVVEVPGADQYTLASQHQIYVYTGGWIADYNDVLDWLGPMMHSSGTYPAINNWNITMIDKLFHQAREADRQGNVTRLIETSQKMEQIWNRGVIFMYTFYPLGYDVASSYLQGYFVNPALGIHYYAAFHY